MSDKRLERAIADTLDDLAPRQDTTYIHDVLQRTARTRQRPAWTFPGRYLDMSSMIAIPILALSLGLGTVGVITLSDRSPTAPADPCPSPAASPTPGTASAPGAAPTVLDCEPWIIYEWFDGEAVDGPLRIKAVRPDGTDAHVVVATGDDPVMHVDWSRDGGRIAFDHWRGEIIDVWTAKADGSDAASLVGCELPCRQLSNPSWSADDTKLVVQRYDKDEASGVEHCYLEVVDVASRSRTVILEGPDGSDGTWECYEHPRWSPDGSRVVFVATRWEQSGSDWVRAGAPVGVVDTDPTTDAPPEYLTDPVLDATHPDWHPTEDLITFGTHHLSENRTTWLATNVYTVAADGTGLQQVTQYGDGDVRATYPTWTPDGTQILFNYVMPVTAGDAGTRFLAFINPDGTGLRVVPGVNGQEARLRPIP